MATTRSRPGSGVNGTAEAEEERKRPRSANETLDFFMAISDAQLVIRETEAQIAVLRGMCMDAAGRDPAYTRAEDVEGAREMMDRISGALNRADELVNALVIRATCIAPAPLRNGADAPAHATQARVEAADRLRKSFMTTKLRFQSARTDADRAHSLKRARNPRVASSAARSSPGNGIGGRAGESLLEEMRRGMEEDYGAGSMSTSELSGFVQATAMKPPAPELSSSSSISATADEATSEAARKTRAKHAFVAAQRQEFELDDIRKTVVFMRHGFVDVGETMSSHGDVVVEVGADLNRTAESSAQLMDELERVAAKAQTRRRRTTLMVTAILVAIAIAVAVTVAPLAVFA